MYFLYTDESHSFVKLTLKEASKKITIINLKEINLEDFGEQGAEIEDMPEYIIGNIKEYGEEVLIDPKTKKLKDDWFT